MFSRKSCLKKLVSDFYFAAPMVLGKARKIEDPMGASSVGEYTIGKILFTATCCGTRESPCKILD